MAWRAARPCNRGIARADSGRASDRTSLGPVRTPHAPLCAAFPWSARASGPRRHAAPAHAQPTGTAGRGEYSSGNVISACGSAVGDAESLVSARSPFPIHMPGRTDFRDAVGASSDLPAQILRVVARFAHIVRVETQQHQIVQRRRPALLPGKNVVSIAIGGRPVAAGEHAAHLQRVPRVVG